MQIAKAGEDDKAFFREVVPDDDRVEVRAMFGNLAAFVHGNMFMGLFGDRVGLRLGEDDREELRAVDGAGDFGPEGRPMKEYVAVPVAWREDRTELAAWIDRSLEHTAAMPPK